MSRRMVLAAGWLLVLAMTALLPAAALFHGLIHLGPGTYRPTRATNQPIIALGSNVMLPAGAQGIVVVVAGNVVTAGRIRDDVVALDGNVYLKPGTTLRRDVLSVLGGVYRAPGVQVQGRIGGALYPWNGRDFRAQKRLSSVLLNSIRLGLAAGVALLLVGTCLAIIFPWQVVLIATTLRQTPIKSVAAGTMALLSFLFLVIPLGLSLAGLPFALLLTGAGVLAWLFGLTSCAMVLGRLIARSPVSLIWSTAAGLLFLALVLAIPLAGPISIGVAGLAGAGALIVALLGRSRPSLPVV